MGVMLYTNIMGLMADYLQEQAWAPLFFLLSVLNLQPGTGVCLFNGMDEFWKALLQFVFPFYPLHSADSNHHCHPQVWLQDVQKSTLYSQESCTSVGHHHAADIHLSCECCHSTTEVHHTLQCRHRSR